MGVNEGNFQVKSIDVDVILENCPITIITYLTKDQHTPSNLLPGSV